MISARSASLGLFASIVSFTSLSFADATTGTQNGSAPTDVAAGVSQQKDSGTVPTENKKADDSTAVAINAGAQFVTGNSRLVAITGGAKLEMRRGDNGFGAALVANYAEAYTAPVAPATNGTWADTVRNLQGKLRYDRFFGPNFSAFIQATGTHDAFQATTFRLNIDPGVKYLFVNKEKTKFWGEIGYDFEFDDNYTDSNGYEQAGAGGQVLDANKLPYVIIETNTMHSARAYLGFRHAFNKEVALSAGLEYLQGFGGSGDGLPNLPPGQTDATVDRVKLDLVRSRLNFDALFTANLGHGLAIGAGFTAKYNSNPLPGKENLDTTTTLTLIFAYATPAEKKKEDAKPVCPTEVGPLVQPPAPQTPPYKKTLAGGYEVVAKPGGTEAKLISSLDDGKPPADAIELDGVGFANDAVDAPASKDQIKNLAEILKAYPNARLVVVAPHARADALKAALEAAGADGKRISTEAHEGKAAVRWTVAATTAAPVTTAPATTAPTTTAPATTAPAK